MVTKVYEFGGGKVVEHLGGIYDFLHTKNIESFQELEKDNDKKTTTILPKEESQGALDWKAQKELRKKEQKIARKIEECEKTIGELEASIHILEDRMSTEEGASDLELVKKHSKLSQQLEAAMEEWTLAEEEKEKLNN